MSEILEQIKSRTKIFEDHVFIDGDGAEYQMISDRHWLIQQAERTEQLESENKRLRERCTEIAAETSATDERNRKRIKQLESENEQMWKALESIKNVAEWDGYTHISQIADQALRGDNT